MGGAPEVYSGFRLSRFANLPVGFVLNLVAVLRSDYQGLRWLLFQQHSRLSIVTLLGRSAIAVLGVILLARGGAGVCRTRGATLIVSSIRSALL